MLVYKSVDCTCGFVVINAFNDSNKEIFVYILHRDVYYAIASELNADIDNYGSRRDGTQLTTTTIIIIQTVCTASTVDNHNESEPM